MNRTPWRAITAAGLIAVGGLAGWAVARAQDDPRQAIPVPEAQRTMILAQMRGFLQSVNGVLNGAMAGDTARMRAAAAAAGMAAMHQRHMAGGGMGPGPHAGMGPGMGPMMGGGMPPAFMQLGHATHNGFDELAAAIARGAGRDSALTRLGDLTSQCVSCHAAYRLEVR